MARTEVRGGQILDASVSLTADVTGTLPVANGGTGAATQTLNSVLLGNGTSAFQNIAPSTSGNVLASDGTTWASTPSGGSLTGEIKAFAPRNIPTGWLWCDNNTISRTTYANLFAALVPSLGTVTITIASPGVFTTSTHLLTTGDQIYLTTTGALPTGLAANTLYYVIYVSLTTFRLSVTRGGAFSPVPINTSGTQSGTHTAWFCPYGLGNGSTTFNKPDLRGRILAGRDMGDPSNELAAARINFAATGGTYGMLGAVGGEQAHILTSNEMPSHRHSAGGGTVGGGGNSNFVVNATGNADVSTYIGLTGGGAAHNVIPPTSITNYIIKT